MDKMMSVSQSLKRLDGENSALFRRKPVLKRNLILAIVVISPFILGIIDYATGHELSFFTLYFLPIAFAAWKTNSIAAYLVATLSAIIWFLSHVYSSTAYSGSFVVVWNGTIRFISFLTVAYGTSRIRSLRALNCEASHDHRSQGKASSGWIPICASCRKIRDDKGHWEEFEDYLMENTDAQFTHGLCQECIDKLLKEAGIDDSSPTDRLSKQ